MLAGALGFLRQRLSRPKTDDAPAGLSVPDLLLEFESLGDNCEFGLVQRYCGADPLGLFRFSFSHLGNLRDAIGSRFAAYGTADDLVVTVNPDDREYLCRSRHYDDFVYHTEQFETDHALADVRARELTKVAYLKRRLGDDLDSAEKIFVRKGHDSRDGGEVLALLAEIRRYGPNTLLWIVESDEDHPPGTAERIADGLIKGWITRFAPLERAHHIDLASWIDVCRAAYAVERGEPVALVPPRRLARGDAWIAPREDELGVRHEAAPEVPGPFPGAVVTRVVRTLGIGTDAVATVALPRLAEGVRHFVFTTWVWIPPGFGGRFADVLITGVAAPFIGRIDLAKTGVWQRVWTSGKLPKGETIARCALRMNSHKGDHVLVASWVLEEGYVPGER